MPLQENAPAQCKSWCPVTLLLASVFGMLAIITASRRGVSLSDLKAMKEADVGANLISFYDLIPADP